MNRSVDASPDQLRRIMQLEGTIGQIHVSVTDIDRAVAFYRDTLGLSLLFQVPGQPMAFFDCGGVRLYLAVPEPMFESKPLLYFRVDAIDQTFEALVADGVEFLAEPSVAHHDDRNELWLAFFRDPDGCVLALMEERALASA